MSHGSVPSVPVTRCCDYCQVFPPLIIFCGSALEDLAPASPLAPSSPFASGHGWLQQCSTSAVFHFSSVPLQQCSASAVFGFNFKSFTTCFWADSHTAWGVGGEREGARGHIAQDGVHFTQLLNVIYLLPGTCCFTKECLYYTLCMCVCVCVCVHVCVRACVCVCLCIYLPQIRLQIHITYIT